MTEYINKIVSYILNEKYIRTFIELDTIKFIFDEKLQKLIQTILNFYSEYGKIPKIDEYDRFIKNEKEHNEFSTLFQKLSLKKPIENYTFIVDQIKNEYANQKFSEIIQTVDTKNIDLHSISSQMSKLANDVDTTSFTKERFIWENVKERYDKVKNKIITQGMKSGFDNLDKFMNGWNKKELALIFARSGIGKTRFLFNFTYKLVTQGYWGMLFSLEMYIEQMERIFDSRHGKINSEDIKYAKADLKQMKRVLKDIEEKKYPLHITEHTGITTLDYITSKIRTFKKKYPLDFVVIDYLQLMRTGLKGLQRDEEFGLIAQQLKNIAKRENIAIITAVQTNRKVLDSDEILLEHIGDSNKIAQNCDFVAYIQRSKISPDRLMDMKILKNREGLSNIDIKFLIDFATNAVKGEITLKTHAESIKDDSTKLKI